MVRGAGGAFMLTLSGFIADQVGVGRMLLLVVPLPALLSILIWWPMLRTYVLDRQVLQDTLAQRRAQLLDV